MSFYVIFVGPLDYNSTTDLPFLLATKRERHKSQRVLLHLTQWKAYVLPSRWYSVQKMDCRQAIESTPAHLNVLQYLQTKSLVRGLPVLGVPLFPPAPTPIVTSNMLL